MNYETGIEAERAAGNPLLEGGEEDRRSRRNLILLALGVLLVIIAIAYYVNRSGTATPADDKKDQAPVVTVVTPGRTTIEGQITATGTLAARREMPVGVPGEGGQIVAVLVEPGQWVRAGQVLAVIDRSVQSQQQSSQVAQIQVAKANARLAQANLDRALKLVSKGFVSKADIDRLTANRDGAVAQVRVAEAQLGVLNAQVRRLNVVAPAAGLVLERRVEPGQIVSAGSGVLFRLAKGGEMELKALLGETDLAALSQGVSASVTPVGAAKSFSGQVWQIAPVIDPATKQGTARIALAYAPELRPGGFASVTIKSGTMVASVLPESAILSDAQGSYVFVVGKDNKAERRPIKQGQITAQGIVITEGLNGSERVVVRAGGFLQPGETIKPVAPRN
ncbi:MULTISPECIES: efflux RND transporter periplasmic adaptor subunit [unclassified Novosphingobium]|uniref:efflux RND transporter periplasmic adaptor subunit n=1 Tax=unclassified Novosphingobium TaxID=2644732 RepID=UPI000EE76970|nr:MULTISPECIES: efflux RND transporter periplasmic adaptor subunit [unclassified Novosphingobium]HCF24264.1 efflux RND transporter periplasmic adaptor subunit [Novosphingobium sp.]HQV02488.1 efflux RND transporter periplasmic adaptor subunit [Novosphingobium sp.]